MFDSEALSPLWSPFDAVATASLGIVADVPGDSFAGDSSLTDSGLRIRRSFMGATCNVTTLLALAPDFRRSFSFAGVDVFVVEGILTRVEGSDKVECVDDETRQACGKRLRCPFLHLDNL